MQNPNGIEEGQQGKKLNVRKRSVTGRGKPPSLQELQGGNGNGQFMQNDEDSQESQNNGIKPNENNDYKQLVQNAGSSEDENMKPKTGENSNIKIMQDYKDSPKRTWKDSLRIGFCSFFAIAFATVISVLWFVPGGQVIAAPLTYAGVSTLIAEIGTTVVFGTGTLISIAAARGNLRLRDLFLPFEFIGEVLRGVAEICLSLISPFLPNKWLAKAYERLHKPICQEEGRIVAESRVLTKRKKIGKKILTVGRNIFVGLIGAVVNPVIAAGRIAIKGFKLIIIIFVKPVIPQKFSKKIDNFFGKAETQMDKATCAVNGLTINKYSPVLSKTEESMFIHKGHRPESLYYKMSVARNIADEIKQNMNQPLIDQKPKVTIKF